MTQPQRGYLAFASSCALLSTLAFACGSSSDDGASQSASGLDSMPATDADVDESGGGEAEANDPMLSSSDGSIGDMIEGQDPDAITNIEPPATPPEAPPAEMTPATPSSGCNSAATPMTGARTLDVAGQARTFVLDVPADYDASRAYPIVFAFHGATTSGEFFRSRFYGNLLSTMSEQAILVHPDALGDPTQWDNAATGADVPFFDALLASLEAELCVDETRVFATGHSSGGFFTNTLGCQRGDVLRAIAPVSGGGPFTRGGANGCRGEVAAWIAHAENDETVLFENGEQSRDRWVAANACGATATAVSPEPCQEYAGCTEGLPVRFCVYQDGHNWPDFAPEGIWEFFSGF